MVMVLTQGFKKGAIITGQGKRSVEERYKTGMELKKILHSILRSNILRIRNSSTSGAKNHILNGLIGHETAINSEGGILRVIFFSYKEVFSEFCH